MVSADVVVFNDLAPRLSSEWSEACSVDFEPGESAQDEDPELDFFGCFWSEPAS